LTVATASSARCTTENKVEAGKTEYLAAINYSKGVDDLTVEGAQ